MKVPVARILDRRGRNASERCASSINVIVQAVIDWLWPFVFAKGPVLSGDFFVQCGIEPSSLHKAPNSRLSNTQSSLAGSSTVRFSIQGVQLHGTPVEEYVCMTSVISREIIMDWEAIGAIGEILGAAAVVVTLLFLVRETRTATRATLLQ